MIVTDLDGTLLRRDKTVSEYTVSTFRRLQNAGIKVVFATARPARAVGKLLNIEIHSDACVYHNGAVVKIGENIVREIGIPCNTANKILKAASHINGTRIAAEINDALYANFDASTIWPGIAFTKSDFSELPELPADKLLFMTTDVSEISKMEELFDESLYSEISENEVLMVMNKDARKRNAVRYLAEHYNISMRDVAAFGDDYNDIEMLRECGIGVAVENAIPEAKAAADFICGDCDGDGVAKWLEEHIILA
jgi:Cof subfamily protein (haloacid dehalogenase superfamily)